MQNIYHLQCSGQFYVDQIGKKLGQMNINHPMSTIRYALHLGSGLHLNVGYLESSHCLVLHIITQHYLDKVWLPSLLV